MKKIIISSVLAVCIALFSVLPALGAMSLSNFTEIRVYEDEFTDVYSGEWYFAGVKGVFEHGIMDGKGNGLFDPSGRLTIAEAIKIAACLHKGYHTGSMDFEEGSPWYDTYVDYALRNGIPVEAYQNFNAWATRSDFAVIIAGALPEEALTRMNNIVDGTIPDVAESCSYGPAVYKLYRAGVLGGSDSDGTFFPGRSISRAEVAAIIMRIVDADARLTLSLAGALTAEQIYRMASPAVFFIEVFDDRDEYLKSGSGFFISETGLAVTNYHVIVGGDTAKITTDDGEVFDVAGIYDFDWRQDLALIQVEGGVFPYLELADSSMLQTGATVYTLGSPLGLQATFSRGIVSQAVREIEGVRGVQYIQIDAPISSGSSGGALLDSSGRVLGVTSATMLGGQITQNLNLAMPINLLKGLDSEEFTTLRAIIEELEYYSGFSPTPDFGAYFDVSPFHTENPRMRVEASYSYRVSDLPGDIDDITDEYKHLIEQRHFSHIGYSTRSDVEFIVYLNPRYNIRLMIGMQVIRGEECITIIVT